MAESFSIHHQRKRKRKQMTDEEFRDRLLIALRDPRVMSYLQGVIFAVTRDVKKD